MELDSVTSTWARTQRKDAAGRVASTAALTFSTPESAMTVTAGGVPVMGARCRLASTSISQVVVGSRRARMVQARIFLEKLSMIAWMYVLVPSSSLRTETSMCQISFGAVARIPTVGLAG